MAKRVKTRAGTAHGMLLLGVSCRKPWLTVDLLEEEYPSPGRPFADSATHYRTGQEGNSVHYRHIRAESGPFRGWYHICDHGDTKGKATAATDTLECPKNNTTRPSDAPLSAEVKHSLPYLQLSYGLRSSTRCGSYHEDGDGRSE
jgi:hypothetical protein